MRTTAFVFVCSLLFCAVDTCQQNSVRCECQGVDREVRDGHHKYRRERSVVPILSYVLIPVVNFYDGFSE